MAESTATTQRPLQPPDPTSIGAILQDLAQRYPEPIRAGIERDVPRMRFNLELLRSVSGHPIPAVCDLGGGIGLFTPACAALNIRATLVDDFGDDVNARFDDEVLQLHRSLGVQIVKSDALDPELDFPDGSFDVVTCFEAIEHWHGSPRPLLEKAMRWLRPGGALIVSVPNCVDLKRRVSVPLGHGKWSAFDDWYQSPQFRGHVRECDADDLKHIAADLSLSGHRIIGKNWWAVADAGGSRGSMMATLARLLEWRPTLCPTLYLVGHH